MSLEAKRRASQLTSHSVSHSLTQSTVAEESLTDAHRGWLLEAWLGLAWLFPGVVNYTAEGGERGLSAGPSSYNGSSPLLLDLELSILRSRSSTAPHRTPTGKPWRLPRGLVIVILGIPARSSQEYPQDRWVSGCFSASLLVSSRYGWMKKRPENSRG